MRWTVALKKSVIADLRWFGRADGRLLLDAALDHLEADPLEVSRNMKTLRPNRVAQRELRLFGKYRILFNVEIQSRSVTIVLVGEKRGRSLIVQGKEYVDHEGDPAE